MTITDTRYDDPIGSLAVLIFTDDADPCDAYDALRDVFSPILGVKLAHALELCPEHGCDEQICLDDADRDCVTFVERTHYNTDAYGPAIIDACELSPGDLIGANGFYSRVIDVVYVTVGVLTELHFTLLDLDPITGTVVGADRVYRHTVVQRAARTLNEGAIRANL